ncbi:hypothetical protein CQA40_03815 [Helicobacter sp. MIT 01-3238]|nr:hypothetical protein CQA40_03815 [Helicobacter sp. MIT 01-3238]
MQKFFRKNHTKILQKSLKNCAKSNRIFVENGICINLCGSKINVCSKILVQAIFRYLVTILHIWVENFTKS